MKSIRAMWISGFAVLLTAFSLPALSADARPSAAEAFHIVLDASAPEDKSSGPRPVDEIRLFFSGEPLMRGASVRVVTSARQLMRTGPPAADPVDPKQLPSELMQMTKKRRVSMGRDGPTISSHQPGDGSSGDELACAVGHQDPGDHGRRVLHYRPERLHRGGAVPRGRLSRQIRGGQWRQEGLARRPAEVG